MEKGQRCQLAKGNTPQNDKIPEGDDPTGKAGKHFKVPKEVWEAYLEVTPFCIKSGPYIRFGNIISIL